MNSPFQRRRPPLRRQRRPQRSNSNPVAALLMLCGILYAIVGLLVVALPPWPWVWLLALVSLGLQIAGLTDPQVLQQMKGNMANLLVYTSILGAAALASALAIAFNQGGTDQLGELSPAVAVFEVLFFGLLATLLAALCSLATATLGHRLRRRVTERQTMVISGVVCLIGLSLGGALGLLAKQG
ncbi:MAG: hypothetical protein ACFCVD_03530 [Nodosilinea sp.]